MVRGVRCARCECIDGPTFPHLSIRRYGRCAEDNLLVLLVVLLGLATQPLLMLCSNRTASLLSTLVHLQVRPLHHRRARHDPLCTAGGTAGAGGGRGTGGDLVRGRAVAAAPIQACSPGVHLKGVGNVWMCVG